MTMAHKYNVRLIKSRKSYSFRDMGLLLNIDRKTCSRWIKEEGLKVIAGNVSPLLILGADLKQFIQEKRSNRKVHLKDGEFFCFKCHRAVRGKVGSDAVIKTGKTVGKNMAEQLAATGICEVCGTELHRFLKVCRKD